MKKKESYMGKLRFLTVAALVCIAIESLSAHRASASNVLTTAGLHVPADGTTLCTQPLQTAIDQLSREGGGRLTFTPGTYLTGGLLIRSGVELHFMEGATLLGSTDPYDYPLMSVENVADDRNDNASMALIMAQKAAHIAITGCGIIDGQGLQLALNADSLHHSGERTDPHYNTRRGRPSELARPKLFFFHDCEDIRVEEMTLRNSANWGLSFDLCRHMTLRKLTIENRAYWNNDGIDLTDCRHVTVDSCTINSADDGICLKSYHPESCCYDINVSHCEIRSSASAVKFGTASWGGFRRIHVSDIRVRDTFRSAIAIECVDGGVADSIVVERIDARNTGNALFLRLGHRAGDKPGSMSHITLRDITCQVPFGRPDADYDLRGPEPDFLHNPIPSPICGIPGHPIRDVRLENISITCPGRATRGMAYIPLWRVESVPEQINRYPEFSMFGELPAFGLYVRHVDGLTIDGLRLELADEDYRPAIVLDDVSNAEMLRLSLPEGLPQELIFRH